MVVTDGSRRPIKGIKKTGYSVVGYHKNKEIFHVSAPLAPAASHYDAEMYALGHAASKIKRTTEANPYIKHVLMFSDSSSALSQIFIGTPHPAQLASILFRHNMLLLFSSDSEIEVNIEWTPGHGGTQIMKRADRLAKLGASKRKAPVLDFTSRSATESAITLDTLSRWKDHRYPIKETSLSYPCLLALRPRLKPPKWFKDLNRPLFSRLTQFVTGHSYIGSYFNNRIKEFDMSCPCSLPDSPIFQTRDHVLRDCPLFDFPRIPLEKKYPMISNHSWSVGHLLKDDAIPLLLEFFKKSGAFARIFAPRKKEPPDKPSSSGQDYPGPRPDQEPLSGVETSDRGRTGREGSLVLP